MGSSSGNFVTIMSRDLVITVLKSTKIKRDDEEIKYRGPLQTVLYIVIVNFTIWRKDIDKYVMQKVYHSDQICRGLNS